MITIYKTANEWLNSIHVLAKNQFGVEINSGKVKLGDGISTWQELNYIDYGAYIGTGKPFSAPEDFGGLGEDDTAIIQAALNSGNNIRFTSGVTYNIAGEITVPSNTVISGYGSKLNLISYAKSAEDGEDVASVKKVFKVEDNSKNVIFDGLAFFADRNKPGVNIGNDTESSFLDSNRECISMYQGVENIIVCNCAFKGVTYCVRFQEHDATRKAPIWRRNIIIKNLRAEDVSGVIDGGRETDGILINNINVKMYHDCTQKHHTIYLRTDLKNVIINDFYIEQDPNIGAPICFSSIRSETEGEEYSELDTVPYGEPIYLSNGEIHGESMGVSTNPYIVYADNVRFVNNDIASTGSVFTFRYGSFGFFNNCTFEDCYTICNGVFTNCKFKLHTANSALITIGGERIQNANVERTVLKDCTIDMNNAKHLIVLNDGDTENYSYSIKLNNCLIKRTGTNPLEEGRVIAVSRSINTAYDICVEDCTFDANFANDMIYSSLYDTANGSVNVNFERSSFKSDKSNYIKSTGNKVTKTYTLCDLNGVMI